MSGGIHVCPEKGQKGNKKIAMWFLLREWLADKDTLHGYGRLPLAWQRASQIPMHWFTQEGVNPGWSVCLPAKGNGLKPALKRSTIYFNDRTWHSFKQFFQVTTILSWGQLCVRYKPALRVRSAIFAYYCIKCKQSTPACRHVGYAWFLSNGSNHLNAHYCV